jgi:hypothetical protein
LAITAQPKKFSQSVWRVAVGFGPTQRSLGRFKLSIAIEVKRITCAEHHAGHQKQSEGRPVPYHPQSENLRNGNVP